MLPYDQLSAVSSRSSVTPAFIFHAALVVAGFTLLFGWLYARPVIEGSFLAESDLYEYYLPVFLSPITIWSSFEFSGMPVFADPQDTAFYPIHFFFARIVGSWTAFVVSAFVMASCFMYAYVYSLTRSRLAAAFAGLTYGLSEAMLTHRMVVGEFRIETLVCRKHRYPGGGHRREHKSGKDNDGPRHFCHPG